VFWTEAKSAKVTLSRDTLHSYPQLAFPFRIVYLLCCRSVLSRSKCILLLYKASVSGQNDGSRIPTTANQDTTLCLCVVSLLHRLCMVTPGSQVIVIHSLAVIRKSVLSHVIETLLCVLSCTYLLSWLEQMCIATFFI